MERIRVDRQGLHIGIGVSLYAANDAEDAPHRPNVYASIDRGLHIGIGVSLYAANDAEDAPHRPNVYVTDVPSDGLVAPER